MRLFLSFYFMLVSSCVFSMEEPQKKSINLFNVDEWHKAQAKQIKTASACKEHKQLIYKNYVSSPQISFDDLNPDVRKLILNEYQKKGVRMLHQWDKAKQQLTIMTFAPDRAKETPSINDPQTLERFNQRLTNEIQTGALLTEQQFNDIKDVHYAVWSNKPFHSKFFGAPIEKRKEEMKHCHMQTSHADIKSVRRLEKTRGQYLIEFNLFFSTQNNGKTGILCAEDTKQLALYDSVSKKTTYLGCPAPGKNFSVTVEPDLATTQVFKNTLQEIDAKK